MISLSHDSTLVVRFCCPVLALLQKAGTSNSFLIKVQHMILLQLHCSRGPSGRAACVLWWAKDLWGRLPWRGLLPAVMKTRLAPLPVCKSLPYCGATSQGTLAQKKTKFSASTKQNSNKQICGALSHALDKGTATAVHPRALRSLRPPAGIHQAHSVGPLVGKEEQWRPSEHTPQDTNGVPLSTLSRTPQRDGGALECFCFRSITRRCWLHRNNQLWFLLDLCNVCRSLKIVKKSNIHHWTRPFCLFNSVNIAQVDTTIANQALVETGMWFSHPFSWLQY